MAPAGGWGAELPTRLCEPGESAGFSSGIRVLGPAQFIEALGQQGFIELR
jgi:hypothetical protein